MDIQLEDQVIRWHLVEAGLPNCDQHCLIHDALPNHKLIRTSGIDEVPLQVDIGVLRLSIFGIRHQRRWIAGQQHTHCNRKQIPGPVSNLAKKVTSPASKYVCAPPKICRIASRSLHEREEEMHRS
ncbi:hypothetical protein GOP47_0028730 [Adiantum capillus-veneris]|nr:hypothetical protein GOP47_0028730 [Adiantum capillus-veneris]